MPIFSFSPFLLCHAICDRPKPQRVHRAHRPRAHGKNIANDTADAGRRALERFDGAGMIMRFDLEGDREVVADVNDPRVFFAGAHENFRRFGRKRFEQRPGIFVTAMLAPHHRKNAELSVTRFASAEDLFGVSVLVRREVVFGNQFGSDGRLGHSRYAAFASLPCNAWITLSKIKLPSALLNTGSHARSGCGIRPATLPRSLQMPAMFSSEPFGLAGSVMFPAASLYCHRIRFCALS